MNAWKKLIATVLAGIALAFSSTSAFALNVGEGGSLGDMQAKLAAEQQVEIMTATTGDMQTLRGLKFFFNLKTKVAYIGMTDNPINSTKMKIIAKTSSTHNGAPSVIPPAIQSVRDCKRLVSEGKAEESNCNSLAGTLETAKNTGKSIVQYGVTPDGNALFAAVNLKSGEGTLYEVTTAGATVAKLPFASGKMH
jgi:hypothetical protein